MNDALWGTAVPRYHQQPYARINNKKVQSPSLCTVMTHHSSQPKPDWKKAPHGLQRPSHTESSSVWPSILDPTLKAAGVSGVVTISIIKTIRNRRLKMSLEVHIFYATPVKVLQVKEVSVDIDEIDDESNHAAEK